MMQADMDSAYRARTIQAPQDKQDLPVAVQILSTIGFAGFAIVSVVLAMVYFWPAGVGLAVVLGWRGGFAPQQVLVLDPGPVMEKVRTLRPTAPEPARRPNASFDAYRADMLRRLEQEQGEFDGFLDRLRAAKDQAEFDKFVDERAYPDDEADDVR